MQRDNKITVLESKLNGGTPAKSAAKNGPSNPSVGKMREVGQQFKSKE